MQDFERYHAAIRFLEGLANMPAGKQYMKDRSNPAIYLKRMRYFLDLVGFDEQGINFIHITGTAGKGTVTTMVHEILHAAGKNVGSFTSPFTTTSIEKIKVGEKYIAPDELAEIVDYLKPFIDRAYAESPYGGPSYFELFVVIALLYFKKQKCDWVVLEVGLGGRYDATNFIKKPIITAITTIDYDHTEILGNTLEEIAWDKAGIIKKGSEFITAEQRPKLLKLFRGICKEVDASFLQVGSSTYPIENNATLATAIANHIGIQGACVDNGIKVAKLPCRFETMQESPRVILDGAHNRVKIQSTVEALRKLKYKRLHLVIGMADSKNKDAMLRQIIPFADEVYVTRFQVIARKCADPKSVLVLSKKYLKKTTKTKLFLDPTTALQAALMNAGTEDLILVTGSFYLAGELRTYWMPEAEILRCRRSFK